MKEAAGEANMTVITIVLIAIVLGVGTLVVTNMMNNASKKSACTSSGYTWNGGECYKKCTYSADGTVDCKNATKVEPDTNGEYK